MNKDQEPNSKTNMEQFTHDLLAYMYAELQKVAANSENYLQLAQKSFLTTEATIKRLKEYIGNYQFKNIEEEIKFFKQIKPQFLNETIYFVELYNIEAHRPIGSKELISDYYNRKLEYVANFFERNREVYNYYRLGKTHMDESFFLRSEADAETPSLYNIEMDYSFSTHYSHILSSLLAFEQLQNYLINAVSGTLSGPADTVSYAQGKQDLLYWNSSEAWFGEFILGLYHSGVIKFEGNLSRFVSLFEMMFNKKVSNIHRLLISMSIRKKDRTPLFNYCINALERKYDEKDK